MNNEIDLHGFDSETAIFKLEDFMNNCAMNGIRDISIIHGHGLGILKKKIYEFLENSEIVVEIEKPNVISGFGKARIKLIKIN